MTKIDEALTEILWNGGILEQPTVEDISAAILTALEARGLVIEQWWRPIETAPKDGRAMQLFIPDCGPDGKGIIASPRSQTDDGSWWDDELQEEIGWTSATHWRPLPEPPARGEG